ncbi:MAG TPA: extracellular solute-binding protein, partial [Flavitalea sp.]|nr:extracellular solute-binding protein [Flavitalea sp.]
MQVVRILFLASLLWFQLSCSGRRSESKELLFWCSNNNKEIEVCKDITNEWNQKNSIHTVHMQPIPEGQSSEEVILAAVVGKTTPDIYANMWQGNVEMYAKAGVLIPLDTLEGFMSFLRDRCDDAVIKEITSADGHIYQVPWKVNPFMAIYNKNLLAANSINEIPTTYDSYLQSAETFKRNNNNESNKKWFG